MTLALLEEGAEGLQVPKDGLRLSNALKLLKRDQEEAVEGAQQVMPRAMEDHCQRHSLPLALRAIETDFHC